MLLKPPWWGWNKGCDYRFQVNHVTILERKRNMKTVWWIDIIRAPCGRPNTPYSCSTSSHNCNQWQHQQESHKPSQTPAVPLWLIKIPPANDWGVTFGETSRRQASLHILGNVLSNNKTKRATVLPQKMFFSSISAHYILYTTQVVLQYFIFAKNVNKL